MSKRIMMAMLSACLLVGVGSAGEMETKAMAVEQTTVVVGAGSDATVKDGEVEMNSAFVIDAELLASDKEAYNISINVKNGGGDWEGIARVSLDGENRIASAYDTMLSLPQGSEKQFVVKVPKSVSESTDGSLRVVLLDKKSKVVADKKIKRFLLDEMESVALGVLSDNYSALTYLDMGGMNMYYYGSQMPVKLVELNQENLTESLDTLAILVVDNYNTAVLTDEEKSAIVLWVNNGGALIVGTGSYAENTLGGIGDIFTGLEYQGLFEPGTVNNLGFDADDSLDVSNLPLANLYVDNNQYEKSYYSKGLISGLGDGGIGIVPYSLTELGNLGGSVYRDITQEEYIRDVIDEMSSSSSMRYNRNNYSSNLYERMDNVRRMLNILGNSNTALNLGGLKVLIVIYVIFVGPILYLILRAAKKREWYWIVVPVTAVLGIIVVFFAGRGFEVSSTSVYSVTTEDLAAKETSKTYLYCYDAKFKEWSLKLGEEYEFVGPLTNNYSYSESDTATKYYHRIQNEGGNISFGIKPSSSFEDSFFYAGKARGSAGNGGSISVTNLSADWASFTGEITNNTDKDFLYFAVIIDDVLYVYKNLPAGGSHTLGGVMPLYSNSQGDYLLNDYLYDFLRDVYDDEDKEEDVAALAALGIGINDAYTMANSDAVVVCGVTKDWNKAVDDDCNEVSYGCLYAVQ